MFAPLFVPQDDTQPENRGWYTAQSLPAVSKRAIAAAQQGEFFPVFETRDGVDMALKLLHFINPTDAIHAIGRFSGDSHSLLPAAQAVIAVLLENPELCLLVNDEIDNLSPCDDERHLDVQVFLSDMLCIASAPGLSRGERMRYADVAGNESLRDAFRNVLSGAKINEAFRQRTEILAAEMVEKVPSEVICRIFDTLLPETEKEEIARAALKSHWARVAAGYDKCTLSGFLLGKNSNVRYRYDIRQEWVAASARPFDLERYVDSGLHPLKLFFIRYEADKGSFASPVSDKVNTAINTECANRFFRTRTLQQRLGGH